VALIEGFRVQNYRSLRDVTIGKLSGHSEAEILTPLTVVIGKNGAGKSTLFDAFGFIADCLTIGVEAACDREQRGGFERLRSMGVEQAIRFEVCYREAQNHRPITYELAIDLDSSGRPFVASEALLQRPRHQRYGRPFAFLRLSRGIGEVWAGEDALEIEDDESDARLPVVLDERWPVALMPVALTDTRQLGIATLGTLGDHPRITRFRDFLKGWYLSYFTPDAARGLPPAGPQRHLNVHGDNLGNVVQFMQRENGDRFATILLATILRRIAERIPNITSIDTHVTEDKRVLLRFNDAGFRDPFFAQQMSDGTLKVFAYLLLLEDPDPPSFLCIEEPENGLYHKLLETLAREFRAHATGRRNAPQIFITTHHPYFLDALAPHEVWILEKGLDGFSGIRRVSDLEVVRNMVAEGLPLGGLWYSDYLDSR
jgi:predicted ATPase